MRIFGQKQPLFFYYQNIPFEEKVGVNYFDRVEQQIDFKSELATHCKLWTAETWKMYLSTTSGEDFDPLSNPFDVFTSSDNENFIVP